MRSYSLTFLYSLTSMISAMASASTTMNAPCSTYNFTFPRNSTAAISFGILLFPAFQALDVFGPLDALNLLSWQEKMNLSLISASMDPVTTAPRSAAMNPFNSSFFETVMPTHTHDSAPPLDVLLVPGGLGTRAPDVNGTTDFIRTRYPQLKYLISVCTGAGLVARAGVLDGRRATTNKRAWNETTALGPKTFWVSHARWMVDGNVWTGSGVSAGIDTTLAWMEHVFGADVATNIANGMEYIRNKQDDDPYAVMYNLTDVPPKSAASP